MSIDSTRLLLLLWKLSQVIASQIPASKYHRVANVVCARILFCFVNNMPGGSFEASGGPFSGRLVRRHVQ